MMMDKRKLVFSGTAAVFLATLIPWFYLEYLKALWRDVQKMVDRVVNFKVVGYHLPWRYMFLGIMANILLLYIKMKIRRKKQGLEKPSEASSLVISGQTLLEIHNARRNVEELSRRLDNAEKTNHLILKQMEAMTKCLAQVLKDGKAKGNNNSHVSLETDI